ncbi:MAG: hypothetical protein WCF19_02065 [Chlamydiales bacterium]
MTTNILHQFSVQQLNTALERIQENLDHARIPLAWVEEEVTARQVEKGPWAAVRWTILDTLTERFIELVVNLVKTILNGFVALACLCLNKKANSRLKKSFTVIKQTPIQIGCLLYALFKPKEGMKAYYDYRLNRKPPLNPPSSK